MSVTSSRRRNVPQRCWVSLESVFCMRVRVSPESPVVSGSGAGGGKLFLERTSVIYPACGIFKPFLQTTAPRPPPSRLSPLSRQNLKQ